MSNPNSSFLYPRSKGLTEKALAELGYADCIIFKPGFLRNTHRPDIRIGEMVAGYVIYAVSQVPGLMEVT